MLLSNLNALDFCSIELSEIMDEESYQQFISSYKGFVSKVLDIGSKDDIEQGENYQEMKDLW